MTDGPHARSPQTDRGFYAFTALLSSMALLGIGYVLLAGHQSDRASGSVLSSVPALNAGLNATAAALLSAGWVAVRRKNHRAHRFFMLSAFVASCLFLIGYLSYHYAHGDTRYAGHGLLRGVYLGLLASHVLLSIPVLPMAMTALYFAAGKRFDRHRRVTRWLAPLWLYVSVTGVLVFLMLHQPQPSTEPCCLRAVP